jgi:hypothetical protein
MSDEETPDERLKRFKEKNDERLRAEAAAKPVEPSFRQRVKEVGQKVIRKYVDTVAPAKPPVEMPSSFKKVENAYYERAHPEWVRQKQELELQQLREQAQAIRDKQQAPRDLGDIDEPQVGTRQPVQMSREFSSKEDEEAYIRAKQAAQRAAGK